MDWAEEKYDVRFKLFLKFLVRCMFSVTRAVCVLSFCAVETPHCSNQNGAQGPILVHPTPNVLDPV